MSELWPELRWEDWAATAETLHMWTQIVGKTRLALHPMEAQWWNVPLYVSARGLSTAAMPYGSEMLEIEFDFLEHRLWFRLSTGATASMALRAQSVAEFYAEYLKTLAGIGCAVTLWPVPVELKEPIPFAEDMQHCSYDPEMARRFWRVLMSADQVFQRFTAKFVGKVSPVHFFWGSFDLAVTRFSGRPAPVREGADAITREAYSQEVISAGFWPGNGGYGKAAFYCYAAPAPQGLSAAAIEPAEAKYDEGLGEFIYLYEEMRKSASPEVALMSFLESTYVAGATLAGWDRRALERQE
ncbi:hypothetical protein GOB94_02405 [Granulicella sp. 5B5]|uniref:DUF5996 family protein n=1 Tax=Granulicella sp. 5B5 TaxID=1617967 RepID=UPI0015F62FE2|nr:DUF5996 family protein [Granulicella sp. 5B5]QMV17681.1 hypothetical protein GOB94_02405 [Granulicella sp. 5B5]